MGVSSLPQLNGLHQFLRAPSYLLLLMCKPLSVTGAAIGLPKRHKPITVQSFVTHIPLVFSSHRLFCSSSSSSAFTYLGIETPSPIFLSEKESSRLCSSYEEEKGQRRDDSDESVESEAVGVANASRTVPIIVRADARKPPTLSVKEKKELASYAHSLGKKLKCQQVGKSGITPSVAASFLETLEANELLKLKVHNNCPGELTDVVKQLEEATGSVIVGQIGRTVILYRPSITKLKVEEKKKQAQRVFMRRRLVVKPVDPKKFGAKANFAWEEGSSFDYHFGRIQEPSGNQPERPANGLSARRKVIHIVQGGLQFPFFLGILLLEIQKY
ncbi:hypothetical protein NE237_023270 [Protea cynaroides]|uniref:CRM domain-containing protein n=1 Tax=Protea cynaroides TaxID=273540 RepID=A0A9Q0K501_9MAGN|nr:hypothetical protein NE237_023270 [Protea cynaroides]